MCLILVKARKTCWISWNWKYRELLVAVLGLETEPKSSEKAADSLIPELSPLQLPAQLSVTLNF